MSSFLDSLKPFDPYSWPLHRNKIEARRLAKKPSKYVIIYIIKLKGQPIYKIGRSTRASGRLKQLKAKYGKVYGKIEIVHLIYSADPNLEQELHKIFSWQKVKVGDSREWFKLSQDDVDWLRTLKFIGSK